MTHNEMQKRVEELGGWSEINAIKVSLEKYQEFLDRDDMPSRDEILADTCGCCQWYRKYDNGDCYICVLSRTHPRCEEWAELRRIMFGYKDGDWREPVRAMIQIMEEALKERGVEL